MTAWTPASTVRGKEFRILAVSGKGYPGAHTAALPADLQDRLGEPTGRCLALIAGTPVDGLPAVGRGYELPMQPMLAGSRLRPPGARCRA